VVAQQLAQPGLVGDPQRPVERAGRLDGRIARVDLAHRAAVEVATEKPGSGSG
jgi:hypothetical protein